MRMTSAGPLALKAPARQHQGDLRCDHQVEEGRHKHHRRSDLGGWRHGDCYPIRGTGLARPRLARPRLARGRLARRLLARRTLVRRRLGRARSRRASLAASRSARSPDRPTPTVRPITAAAIGGTSQPMTAGAILSAINRSRSAIDFGPVAQKPATRRGFNFFSISI
jgi:hypothetical protein